MNDLFGGEPQPLPTRRRIVQHQPAENPLVFYQTIGSAEQAGVPRGPEVSSTRQAPHVRGSATSRAAAVAVTPTLVGKRLVMLREVCGTDLVHGFTDNELIRHMVKAYGWNGNTPRARRIELVRDGWIEKTESTRDRSTVWVPSVAAIDWYVQEGAGK